MGEQQQEKKEESRSLLADPVMIKRLKAFEAFLVPFADVAEQLWEHGGFSKPRFVQTAIQAMQRTPKLLQCETLSIIGALRACAELSLYPDDLRGHAYLVPKQDKNIGMLRCHMWIGYLGYVYLLRRTGLVTEKGVTAERVFEGDTCEIEKGLNPVLRHIPLLEARKERKLQLVYAIIHYKGGNVDFDFLMADQIAEIESVYAGKSSDSPWTKSDISRSWMEKKTVIKQVLKLSPALDYASTMAIAIDDKGEMGVDQKLDLLLDKGTAELARSMIDRSNLTAVAAAIQEGAAGSKLDTFMGQKVSEKRQRDREAEEEAAKLGGAPGEPSAEPKEGVTAVTTPDGTRVDVATGEDITDEAAAEAVAVEAEKVGGAVYEATREKTEAETVAAETAAAQDRIKKDGDLSNETPLTLDEQQVEPWREEKKRLIAYIEATRETLPEKEEAYLRAQMERMKISDIRVLAQEAGDVAPKEPKQEPAVREHEGDMGPRDGSNVAPKEPEPDPYVAPPETKPETVKRDAPTANEELPPVGAYAEPPANPEAPPAASTEVSGPVEPEDPWKQMYNK